MKIRIDGGVVVGWSGAGHELVPDGSVLIDAEEIIPPAFPNAEIDKRSNLGLPRRCRSKEPVDAPGLGCYQDQTPAICNHAKLIGKALNALRISH